MRNILPSPKKQAGFSLIEFMISAMILAVVAGGAVYLLNQSQASFRSQVELSRQTRQLRVAMDQILRYFRQAGADPQEATGTNPIDIISSNHVRLNSDVTGTEPSTTSDPKEATGDPDGLLSSIYEQVEIRFDAQDEAVYINIGYGEELLAEDISVLTFTFYDQSGAVTTDPTQIVRVHVRISGSAEDIVPNADRTATVTLESDVFIRSKASEILI